MWQQRHVNGMNLDMDDNIIPDNTAKININDKNSGVPEEETMEEKSNKNDDSSNGMLSFDETEGEEGEQDKNNVPSKSYSDNDYLSSVEESDDASLDDNEATGKPENEDVEESKNEIIEVDESRLINKEKTDDIGAT